jgi:hypothetical protein
MRFLAVEPISHGDEKGKVTRYEPGDILDISSKDAAPHVASGALEPAPKSEPPKEPAK